MIVVGSNIGDGVATIELPDRIDDIPQLVEIAAQSKGFDGILKFELDGKTYLPIFNDTPAANAFCGAYVDLLSSIHAFRLFSVPATTIAASIADEDSLLYNAQNEDEVELTTDQTRKLKGLLTTDNSTEPMFLSVSLPMPGFEKEITFLPEKS